MKAGAFRRGGSVASASLGARTGPREESTGLSDTCPGAESNRRPERGCACASALFASACHQLLRTTQNLGFCGCIVGPDRNGERASGWRDASRLPFGEERTIGHLGHHVAERRRTRKMAVDDALQPFRGQPGYGANLDQSPRGQRRGGDFAPDRLLKRLYLIVRGTRLGRLPRVLAAAPMSVCVPPVVHRTCHGPQVLDELVWRLLSHPERTRPRTHTRHRRAHASRSARPSARRRLVAGVRGARVPDMCRDSGLYAHRRR